MNFEYLSKILLKDAEYVNRSIRLNSFDGKIILITGATGLIGLNLIAAMIFYKNTLKDKQITIYAVSHTKPEGFIGEFFTKNNINIIFGDITDYSFLKKLPKAHIVMHCAGYGQPGKFMANKIKTIAINTTSTIELLGKIRKDGNFLFISSSEIYSGNINEDEETYIGYTNTNHPRSCYIEGKRTGEAIVNAAREEGMNAVSARLALAYGPGVKHDDVRVLNQLISKGLKGRIDLLDSGSAIRTYGYVSDIVIMLLNLIIKSKHSFYNVGGESTLTIKGLAEKIGQKLNSKVFLPENLTSGIDGAPDHVELNLNRIKDEYGLTQFIDIDEGLKRTIEWIKNS